MAPEMFIAVFVIIGVGAVTVSMWIAHSNRLQNHHVILVGFIMALSFAAIGTLASAIIEHDAAEGRHYECWATGPGDSELSVRVKNHFRFETCESVIAEFLKLDANLVEAD